MLNPDNDSLTKKKVCHYLQLHVNLHFIYVKSQLILINFIFANLQGCRFGFSFSIHLLFVIVKIILNYF